jgi:hypothetical protein
VQQQQASVQSWKARVKKRAGRLNIQEWQWPLSSVKHGKSDLGCRRAPDHRVTAQSTQRPPRAPQRERERDGEKWSVTRASSLPFSNLAYAKARRSGSVSELSKLPTAQAFVCQNTAASLGTSLLPSRTTLNYVVA